jgi:hypothetical protein
MTIIGQSQNRSSEGVTDLWNPTGTQQEKHQDEHEKQTA